METPKRPASDYLDEPAPKRRLFGNRRTALEHSDRPTPEPDSYEWSPTPLEPQMFYPKGLADYPSPGSEPDPVPPREVVAKNFPIIKNGKKYFRIGVDINNFTPCVSLVSETTNKVIHFTLKEFEILLSEDIFNTVLKNYENKSVKPVIFGDVEVSIKPYLSSNNISIFRKRSSIYFALSSWKFLQRIKTLVKNYLSDCQTQSFYGSSNFVPLLNHAKHFCAPLALDKVSESEVFSALSSAFDTQTIFFPESLKQEILCYHLEFLRDKLLE